jgi:hypothetical protein
MDQFEKKPWNVNDPYCETCRGFGFLEKEGHPHRWPCVCQATFIPFDSIIVDESLNVRADDAGTDQFKAFLASINEEGLLKPLIVVWDGDAYKLVNGFRRYRAITELRALDRQAFEKIPVFILALNSKEAIARCILGNL